MIKDSSSSSRTTDTNMEAASRISDSDRLNGLLQYPTEKSDSFVIDVDSLKNNNNNNNNINNDYCTNTNKDVINSPISRIVTLQKSLSRKGSFRGEKKISCNNFVNDKDNIVSTSSPRGPSTPEKAILASGMGTANDHCSSPQLHYQTTFSNGNINGAAEGKSFLRRNSFKRQQASWAIDPRRVLFLFATLSSIGTMLLIYFTLSIGKLNSHDDALD